MAQLETFTPGNEKYTTKKIGELVYVGTNSGGSLKIFVEPNKYLEIANTTWGSGGGGTSSGKYCTGYLSASTYSTGLQYLGTYDTNDSGMTVNAGQITITESGRYLINMSVFTHTGGNNTVSGGVAINLSNVLFPKSASPVSADTVTLSASKIFNLNVGDVIGLYSDGVFTYHMHEVTFLQVQQL